MNDVKHTAEPWNEGEGITRINKLLECADYEAGPECSDTEWVETKRRIVAAVNACDGISTVWLESGCTGWLNNTREERAQYQRERDNAIYQRDQLLAALEAHHAKSCGAGLNMSHALSKLLVSAYRETELCRITEQAISAAEGGAPC